MSTGSANSITPAAKASRAVQKRDHGQDDATRSSLVSDARMLAQVTQAARAAPEAHRCTHSINLSKAQKRIASERTRVILSIAL